MLDKEQFDLACRRTSTTTFREIFHAHAQMEVTYIHDGYGQLITEGQAFPLKPGTLMIFRPFQLHQVQIQVTDEHPFVRSVLMYDLDVLKETWRYFTATHHFVQEFLGQPSPIALSLFLLLPCWCNSWNSSRRFIPTDSMGKKRRLPGSFTEPARTDSIHMGRRQACPLPIRASNLQQSPSSSR